MLLFMKGRRKLADDKQVFAVHNRLLLQDISINDIFVEIDESAEAQSMRRYPSSRSFRRVDRTCCCSNKRKGIPMHRPILGMTEEIAAVAVVDVAIIANQRRIDPMKSARTTRLAGMRCCVSLRPIPS